MKNSSLLCLAPLLLLAASPLAGAWSLSCSSDGSYAANSTYEANLRRLAAVLPAEASASPGRYVDRSIGYWPNRPRAVSRCPNGDGNCAACIADAFKLVEVECPFSKEAAFFSRSCSLRLDEYSIFGSDLFGEITVMQILMPGMIFQAIGLVCIFLMFLQVWRHDTKKGFTPLLYPESSKSEA
ncbi:hypothetical protein QOZ80_7AG0570370 [Eleusine coracana subsp. coracana]|nr:hypothetical protein QOZ80_7AG0570370 [Eleusine coracana subsp. coracana]